MRHEYFEWLVSKVTSPAVPDDAQARIVLQVLRDIRIQALPMADDAPRLEDGKQLRSNFMDDTGMAVHSYKDALEPESGFCTVLELLVALSMRMDDIMRDPLDPCSSIPSWFWGMVSTMVGQPFYPCSYWTFSVDASMPVVVAESTMKFLGRQYDPTGHNGNVFIDMSGVDLRAIDIWAQACHFMSARRHIAPQPGTSVWYPQTH